MNRQAVPFKQQMSDSDCGSACLAMVLAYYGHHRTVHETRVLVEEFGPPQSTRSLIAAGRKLGLECNLVAADLPQLAAARLPMILYWEFSHFVVLVRRVKGGYELLDPAVGQRMVTDAEFDVAFTGIAIELAPTPALAACRPKPNAAFYVYLCESLLTRAVLGHVSVVIALAIFLQLVSLLGPALTLYVVDTLMPANAIDLLVGLLPLIVIVAVNFGLLSYLRAHAIVFVQRKVDEAMLGGFMHRLLRLPADFFLDRSAGDIQSRMNSSTLVREAVSNYTVTAVLDVVMALSYLLILAYMAPIFAAVALTFAAAQLGVYLMRSGTLRTQLAAEIRDQASHQSLALEILNGILTIKGAAAEGDVERSWRARLSNYLISSELRARTDAWVIGVTSVIKVSAAPVLFWVSALLYFNGALSMGAVLALNSVAVMALVPLSSLVSIVRQIQSVRANAERLADIWLHGIERAELPDAPPLGEVASIILDNVTYRYASSRQPALDGVSLEIRAGRKIGIVGPSGSGKSTLASLILGFYRPLSGSVRVGGHDLNTHDLARYRQAIGYVTQTPFLLNGSLRRNIALGQPELSLDEIATAARVADAHSFIEQLPMKYETRAGESGVNLSGGQRQRLCIARAVAAAPALLILDEATSSLDSGSEASVSLALRGLACAQLIITHRLSTVRDCDDIYVLEAGRITAHGAHAELLRDSDFYRACFIAQGGHPANQTTLRDLQPEGVVA